jgi:hypothetical protein
VILTVVVGNAHACFVSVSSKCKVSIAHPTNTLFEPLAGEWTGAKSQLTLARSKLIPYCSDHPGILEYAWLSSGVAPGEGHDRNF